MRDAIRETQMTERYFTAPVTQIYEAIQPKEWLRGDLSVDGSSEGQRRCCGSQPARVTAYYNLFSFGVSCLQAGTTHLRDPLNAPLSPRSYLSYPLSWPNMLSFRSGMDS